MKRCVFLGDFLAGERILGVQRYGIEILRALDELLDEREVQIEFEVLAPQGGELTAQFKHIKAVRRGQSGSRLKKYIWQQMTFPAYVLGRRAIGVDMTLSLPVLGRHIVSVPDCIHEAYPENFKDHRLFHWLYLIRAWLIAHSRNKQLFTLSHESIKEIEKYYPSTKGRVALIGSGWEHMEHIEADMSIFERIKGAEKGSYFFALGSHYKHKNFQWILKTAQKNPEHTFVITGAADLSAYAQVLDGQKPENVNFTGYLTDEEIKALMMHCRALIQPSFYEGFGIPPLEALSVGGAAIVSNASCLPEIYQDAVRYIDPDSDGCDIEEIMAQPTASPEKVLEKYTWRNAARQLLELIERQA